MQDCVCELPSYKSLNFSFHTFELSIPLSFDEYSHLATSLYQSPCRTRREEFGNSTYIKSNLFSAQGALVCLRYAVLGGNAAGLTCCDLILRINPRIAIGDVSYTGIYECTPLNNRTLVQFLIKIVTVLGLANVSDITSIANKFRISRLDLCVNYKFESDYLASKYLKLLRRGNRTDFLTEKTYYDDMAKRTKPYKNALVLNANSFNISIYNKAAQMKDNAAHFAQVPESAIGLLRFEMQLRPGKLHYCTKGTSATSFAAFLLQIEELCRAEFKRYSKTLFCTGD